MKAFSTISIFFFLSSSVQSNVLEYHLENIGYHWDKVLSVEYTCVIRHIDMSTGKLALEDPYSKIKAMFINSTINTIIPIRMKKLPAIINFSVLHTDLSVLSRDKLKVLKNIVNLYLGKNMIDTIAEESFDDLQNVEIFYLNDNRIEHLSTTVFREMKSLEKLILSGNYLTEISSDLFNIPTLKRVFVNRNLIMTVNFERSDLSSIRELNIEKNICLDEIKFSINNVDLLQLIKQKCNSTVANFNEMKQKTREIEERFKDDSKKFQLFRQKLLQMEQKFSLRGKSNDGYNSNEISYNNETPEASFK
jgi:Leucine rich repeat